MIIQKYSLVHFLWVLVAVMAGFYMAGLLLRVILNKAFKDLETEEEKPSEDEGTAGEGEGTPEQMCIRDRFRILLIILKTIIQH